MKITSLFLAGLFLLTFGLANFTHAQSEPDVNLAPKHVRIWRDHVVDWAFNQPHFSSEAAPAAATVTLAGRVIPPPGKSATAIVLIWCAERKPGVTYSASTRYPHLPHRTQADREGNFKFEALDGIWSYDVRVIAAGCEQQSFISVDPTSGPLVVQLEPVKSTNLPPDPVIHGRVLDTRGKAIPGAVISILETTRNGNWNYWADNIDPYAASDDTGNFAVYGRAGYADAGGAVEAPGFATALFEHFTPGDTIHEVTLTEGASLQGRLLQAGKPVTNAEIHICRFGRESGSSMWDYFALTDNQGRFSFAHLPPNRSCRLSGIMESLRGLGAVPTTTVQTHADGSTNDIGDLSLAPAFKVEGQIRLRGGKPIPANAQVILSHDETGDAVPFALGKDGMFHFAGVPAGAATLFLWIPGYQLTPRDAFLISGSAAKLTVIANITDLVIEMKPRSFWNPLYRIIMINPVITFMVGLVCLWCFWKILTRLRRFRVTTK